MPLFSYQVRGTTPYKHDEDLSDIALRNLGNRYKKKRVRVQGISNPETPMQCWKSVSTTGIQSG
jgi:hypothetical protein